MSSDVKGPLTGHLAQTGSQQKQPFSTGKAVVIMSTQLRN